MPSLLKVVGFDANTGFPFWICTGTTVLVFFMRGCYGADSETHTLDRFKLTIFVWGAINSTWSTGVFYFNTFSFFDYTAEQLLFLTTLFFGYSLSVEFSADRKFYYNGWLRPYLLRS